jgi:hypothetical protein
LSLTGFRADSHAQDATITPADGRCISSFAAFAFRTADDETGLESMSSPKWEVQATVPTRGFEDDYYDEYSRLSVALSRFIDGHQEIWITGQAWVENFMSEYIILVYSPTSQEWKFIPAVFGDTGLRVANLYVGSDGAIWGQVIQETVTNDPDLESFPVLSKFNETTERFEFVEGALEIPIIEQTNGWRSVYDNRTEIFLDHNNAFWIIVRWDGFYHYDPATQTTVMRAESDGDYIGYTALAPDGSIYFTKPVNLTSMTMTIRDWFTLPQGTLFHYFPETDEIIPVDDFEEELPVFSGLLVDHRGRLWLGSIAYREPDGTWHSVLPDPEEFLNSVKDFNTGKTAAPIMESSDGTLWFEKFMDTSGAFGQGTGWYDPETGEGCRFTTEATNIVEDSNQTLWIVADEILYSYALDSE